MVADRSGQENLVAGTNGARIDGHLRHEAADAGSCDVHAVGFAALNYFRISADHDDARPAKCGAMARTSPSRTDVGSPSSRTKVTTMAWPFAPETARSFMVPFTASSPIEPPGNLSGFTTKLSVVIAIAGAIDIDVRSIAQRRY